MSGGWQVAHLQVSDVGPLTLPQGNAGVYACFWHGLVPLGHTELVGDELPLSSPQARQLAARVVAPAILGYLSAGSSEAAISPDPLPQLEALCKPGDGSFARDTAVIVCTRNRAPQLADCLRSLCAQTSRPAEIVVVDNTAGDRPTEQVVAAFAGARYVVAPHVGLSRARNVGIRHSSRPLIAFTDDDTVVTTEWLGELTKMFNNPEVVAASGLVFPAELRTHTQIEFERDLGRRDRGYTPRVYRRDFLLGPGARAAPVWNICAGANMAVWRSALERFGLFDERLGVGAAGGGEDAELWYRILSRGGACAYVPTAVVHHHHPIEADLLGDAFYFYMRGHVAALLTQFAASREWRNLHRVLVELPNEGIEILVRWLSCREPTQRVMLNGIRGCAAGVWYWLMRPWRRT